MKTIFRLLSGGVLAAAILAVGAVAGFGQATPATPATPNANCADIDGHNALYTKFTGIYLKKTLADMENALSTGKEYLEKFGSCEGFKEQVDFVRPHVERIEKQLPGARIEDAVKPFYKRFDAGIGPELNLGKMAYPANIDELYLAGKEILAKKPDDINFMVPLALGGFYEMFYKDDKQTKNTKYSDDTIRYAQAALAQLKAGKEANRKSSTGVPIYGFLKYGLPKEDLINELTYSVGYLTFYAKNNRAGALPYFYELSQSSRYKNDARIYATIGSHFGAEVLRLNSEIAKLLAQQKALPTDEAKLAMEPQIKSTIAMLNGTAERAMDYYSRAFSFAKDDNPSGKTYKASLYKDLSVLYEGRFSKKDGLDTYIASVINKPMPNPTAPVTPISDPETTTTTGAAPAPSAPATTSAKPAATPATTAAKPATKPMSTTVTKTSVAKKGTRK